MSESSGEPEDANFFISPKDLTVHIGDGDFLGNGAFGKVYRCYDKRNDTELAVKMFSLVGSRNQIESIKKEAQKEMEMMLLLQKSENIVQVFGITEVHYCMIGLVMEYLPHGSLSDLVQNCNDPYDRTALWPVILRIMQETASGLAYLHTARFDKRVTHNDLKPENVLLDANFHAKLCDFGGSNLASYSSKRAMSRPQKIVTETFTTVYAAPEYLTNDYTERTRAMDVYSYGMMLYFVLTRKIPFWNFESATVIWHVGQGKHPSFSLDEILKDTTDGGRSIVKFLTQKMKQCWVKEPDKRPHIREVESAFKEHLKSVTNEEMENSVGQTRLIMAGKSKSMVSERVDITQKVKEDLGIKVYESYDSEMQPLLSTSDENPRFSYHKQLDSTSDPNFMAPKIFQEAPQEKQREQNLFDNRPAVKATLSQPGKSTNEPVTVNQVIEIVISPSACNELRTGDKIYIRIGSKLAECVVEHAYSN